MKLLFESTYRREEFSEDIEGELSRFTKVHGVLDEVTREFADHLVRGVLRSQDELDAAISTAAQNWRLDRIGLLEKTILRVGLYELRYPDQRGERDPKEIVIDEAVELAKIYASDDAPAFINGILDALAPAGAAGSPCGEEAVNGS